VSSPNKEQLILLCVAALATTVTLVWVALLGWAIGSVATWVL
jgi:hypothetical protein